MPGTVTSANGDRGTIRLESGPELETRVDGIGPGDHCYAVVRPEKLLIHHASERLDGGLRAWRESSRAPSTWARRRRSSSGCQRTSR